MRVKVPALQQVWRFVACFVFVETVSEVYRHALHVNSTTVALTFLLLVLLLAAYWGLSYSVLTAILATLTFNYYFLPPVGTFSIADPQNWAALFAFLTTAGIANHLADSARRQTADANEKRRDLERLYSFSQRLLATDNVAELLNLIPGYVREGFGGTAVAMYLVSSQLEYRTDPLAGGINRRDLEMVGSRGEPVIDTQRALCFTPLRLGARLTGAVGIAGVVLSRSTLEALGSMIAIAIERAHAIEKLGQTEAARQSENLRVVLLDSVTHELRTPLTGIKAAVTGLLSSDQLDEGQRKDLLTVINEEADRLDRLVAEATEMAQLDAHKVELQLEPVDIADLLQSVLAQSHAFIGDHRVEIRTPPSLPNVRLDPDRIAEVLKQLLENAAKYSASNAAITLSAEAGNQSLTISVADGGPGIEEFEQSLIFEKFYRGRDQRYHVQGTGMGLAIAKAIIEAHGGSISVISQLGRGSVFSINLPLSGNRA